MRLPFRQPSAKVNPTSPMPVVNVFDHDLIDRLAPPALDFSVPDCCKFSETRWLRIWYVRDWPRTLSYVNWRRILHFAGNVRISLFLNPLDPALVSRQLEQQATAIQSGRMVRAMQKRDPSLIENQKYKEIVEELHYVQVEGDPFFYLTAVFGVFGETKDELDGWSKQLEALFYESGMVCDRALWQHQEGIHALLPQAMNTLGNHQRNVRLDSLRHLFPFTGDEILQPDGIFYGHNRANGMTMILDPFTQENPHTIVIGTSGGGKSYFMKDVIEQYVLRGARAHVIDVDGEYAALCKDLGGVYLDMGIKSKYTINVLDPDPDSGLVESFEMFKGWLLTAIGRAMTAGEGVALYKAYKRLFTRFGMSDEQPASLHQPAPRLSDLHDELLSCPSGDPSAFDALELANLLYPMAVGMESTAFNCATNLNLRDNSLVVFGLKSIPRDSPILTRRIRQIQQFTWHRMMKDTLTRTVEIVDEAWFLLEREDTARDLAERARRFRKRNGALFIATQQVSDFATSRHAQAVLNIAATHILFKQQMTVEDEVAALFKLTAAESGELRRLRPGEYLLLTSTLRAAMFKPAPPVRHGLYTTKPEEVLAGRK